MGKFDLQQTWGYLTVSNFVVSKCEEWDMSGATPSARQYVFSSENVNYGCSEWLSQATFTNQKKNPVCWKFKQGKKLSHSTKQERIQLSHRWSYCHSLCSLKHNHGFIMPSSKSWARDPMLKLLVVLKSRWITNPSLNMETHYKISVMIDPAVISTKQNRVDEKKYR